jgi:hypothetical protein
MPTKRGTAEDSSVVQNEGARKVRRKIRFYNLDIIISVGYRVKSRQGTQFRQWATRVLRDHIVKDYTLNEQRFREQAEKLADNVLVALTLLIAKSKSDEKDTIVKVIVNLINRLND